MNPTVDPVTWTNADAAMGTSAPCMAKEIFAPPLACENALRGRFS